MSDIISMNNRRKYEWKGYDIQVVDIQPGDTILFHVSDDADIETVFALMKEMNNTFPNNTIIPVNEWILKGMTIVRQSKPVADMVDISIIGKPLEEEYPELFKDDYWYWQGGSK
jgi:hypothetical protein